MYAGATRKWKIVERNVKSLYKTITLYHENNPLENS